MDDLTPKPPRSLLARIFISPDERRLRALWRLLGFFILQFILGSLLTLPLAIFRLIDDLGFVNWFLLAQTLSLIAITLATYLARRFLDRRSFPSLGLNLDRWALWDLMAGVGIPALMMGLIYFVEFSLGWLTFEGFAWQVQPFNTISLSTLSMFVVFIVVSWQEELMFRGYLLQNITDGLNLIWGIIISSLLFGLAHWSNPNANVMSVIGILAAGIFLAYAYSRTKQLWLPIGLHLGWNFFEGTIFGFPVSGLTTYSIVRQSVTGPDWVTGGAFGPEAGFILIPAIALGTILVYGYSRVRRNN